MKNFLQKLLLLMVLFLGGCGLTENTTPTDTLIYYAGGKYGKFTADLGLGDGPTEYGFAISDNADFYIGGTSLYAYTTGSDNSAIYEGTTIKGYHVKYELTSINSSGGVYNMTFDGIGIVTDTYFTWYTPSSESAELSSIILDQQ